VENVNKYLSRLSVTGTIGVGAVKSSSEHVSQLLDEKPS